MTFATRDEYLAYAAERTRQTGVQFQVVVHETCSMCGERFAADRWWAHRRDLAGLPVEQCRSCHPGGWFDAP